MEHYSAMKKKEIMPFAVTMDATRYQLSDVRKKNTNTTWYHLYVESQEWHEWSYLWNRNRLTIIQNRVVFAKVEVGLGQGWSGELGSADVSYYIEWINKVLLYITGSDI